MSTFKAPNKAKIRDYVAAQTQPGPLRQPEMISRQELGHMEYADTLQV